MAFLLSIHPVNPQPRLVRQAVASMRDGSVVACFRASRNRGIRAEAGRRPQAPQGSRGGSNHQERSGGLRRSGFRAHGEIEWGIHSRH